MFKSIINIIIVVILIIFLAFGTVKNPKQAITVMKSFVNFAKEFFRFCIDTFKEIESNEKIKENINEK